MLQLSVASSWVFDLSHPVVFVQSGFVNYFSDQYNTINDITFIYLSHSLLHVAAGNYGHHWLVLR
jgi:hypothetical protein